MLYKECEFCSKKLLIHQRLSFYDTILFLLIFSMLFVGTRLNTFLIGITKMITSLCRSSN